MGYQCKELLLSLAIHTSVFMLAISLRSDTRKINLASNKPVAIHFSIVGEINPVNESSQYTSSKPNEKNHTKKIIQKNTIIKTKRRKNAPKKPADSLVLCRSYLKKINTKDPVKPIEDPSISSTRLTKKQNEECDVIDNSSNNRSPTGINVASYNNNKHPKYSLKETYITQHFEYIRDRILKSLFYPRIARKMGWEGKIIVSFVVYGDGHVEHVKILESSGFKILDKNTVKIIKKASPFPRPPVKAELIIPIEYKLEQYD